MSGPDHLEVTAALHESEWRVHVVMPGQGEVFLTPTAAKDASQRLFHLALEISEREGQPQGATEVEVLKQRVAELREELRREREKKDELARKLAELSGAKR